MKIIYRISDTGYNKVKPFYINNSNCFKNAVQPNHPFFLILGNHDADDNVMNYEINLTYNKSNA